MVGHPSLPSPLWWLLGSKDDSELYLLISCLIEDLFLDFGCIMYENFCGTNIRM